jgi:hypothetical protein
MSIRRDALWLWRCALAAASHARAIVNSVRAVPAARERALATAVFAAIFAFALGSVDYLITGGPDWNPGGMGQAYAMEVAHPRYRAPQSVPAPASEALVLTETVAIEEEDYSIATEELLGGPDALNYAEAAFYPANASGKGGAAAAAETLMSVSISMDSSRLKGVSAFETASPW